MTIKHTRLTSTNDSNAIVLTAGAKKIIEVMNLHLIYTSTATAGNRQIRMAIQDETDTSVSTFSSGGVQAASLTYHYIFSRGVYRETAFIDNELQCPIPFGTILLPGWDLIVLDNAAIDAAADDMVIDVIYKEFNDRSNSGIIGETPIGAIT